MTRTNRGAAALLIGGCVSGTMSAAVVTDGTVGHAGPVIPSAGLYSVPASLGQTRGPNLFHSFSRFDLASGEAATFSGPTSIKNVLARVTGGTASTIDGGLQCTIPGANFYLINPSGVVFGPNAVLDVQGSFAVTTADLIKLKDGGVFHASNPSASVLTSAAPSAFGFLRANPAAIQIAGPASGGPPAGGLAVPAGSVLSIVGGKIQASDVNLQALGGRVNLVAAGGPGEVKFDPSDPASAPDTSAMPQFASATLSDAVVAVDSPADQNNNPLGPSGSISIHASDLTLDQGTLISTVNGGDSPGGGIDIRLTGTLTAKQNVQVQTETVGSAPAGPLSIHADTVVLGDGTTNDVTAIGTIAVAGTGAGGSIDLSAHTVQLQGGKIFTTTAGLGPGGDVNVTADVLTLDNPQSLLAASSQDLLQTGATDFGPIGNFVVHAGRMQLTNGAMVVVRNLGGGGGGHMTLDVQDLSLDGDGTQLLGGAGADGGITLHAGTMSVSNGALVSSSTSGNVNAGPVSVAVDGLLSMQSGATIASEAVAGIGSGGAVTVSAGTLQMGDSSHIAADSTGDGASGSIDLKANSITIIGGAVTSATQAAGAGGTIRVVAGSLQLDNGTISTTTTGSGAGGSVSVTATSLQMSHVSIISSDAGGGSGAGGSVDVQAQSIMMDGGPQIESATLGVAPAGSVHISAGTLAIGKGIITAETLGPGNGGNVVIDAGEIRLTGSEARVGTPSLASGPNAISGNGGNITIHAQRLIMRGGAEIFSSAAALTPSGDIEPTARAGTAGAIDISAGLILMEDPVGSDDHTTINSATISMAPGSGSGGEITVRANRIALIGPVSFNASTGGPGNGGGILVDTPDLFMTDDAHIGAVTLGSGAGGSISLNVGRLASTQNAAITVESKGSGNAGSVMIHSAGDVSFVRGASLTAASAQSDAGSLSVVAGGNLRLRRALVTAKAGGEGGNIALSAPAGIVDLVQSQVLTESGRNGGNLVIDPTSVILQNSVLSANAQLNGGNITVRPDILLTTGSRVTATGTAGVNGTVSLTNPNPQIINSVVPIPASFAHSELQQQCGVRFQTNDVSSFIVTGQGGQPPGPTGWLPENEQRE